MRLGLLTASPTRLMADISREASCSYVIVDAEGTTLTPQDSARMVSWLAASRVDVMVRVPMDDLDLLVEHVNTGVDEIVLPQVVAAEEVAEVFRRLHLPDVSHVPRLSVILETVQAVDRLQALLALPFPVSYWLGARDLADDLAAQGMPANSLNTMLHETTAALRAAGRGVGLGAADRAGVRLAREAGAARCSVYWEHFLLAELGGLVAECAAPAASVPDPARPSQGELSDAR